MIRSGGRWNQVREFPWKVFNGLQRSPILLPVFRALLLRLARVPLHPSARIAEFVYLGSRRLQMGQDSAINVGAFIDGSALVSIGDFARVGPHVKILTGTHSYRESVVRRRKGDETIARSVYVGTGAWIGVGATLMPGVVIAEGCVVAAGAVVTRDTEPNGLYAGVPARRVRDLSTSEDSDRA